MNQLLGVFDCVLHIAVVSRPTAYNNNRRDPSAEQVVNGLKDIIARVKTRGLKIIGATFVPRHNVAPVGGNTGWSGAKTKVRNEANAWIRESGDSLRRKHHAHKTECGSPHP